MIYGIFYVVLFFGNLFSNFFALGILHNWSLFIDLIFRGFDKLTS